MSADRTLKSGKMPDKETLSIGQTMLRISSELSDTARTCTEMQWLVSALLEQAHHPDLPAELHMLQDIDKVQQVLEDLAALLLIAAKPAHALYIEKTDIEAHVKLVSLRARILGTANNEKDEDQKPDVTWL